jgi:hypothetical protein
MRQTTMVYNNKKILMRAAFIVFILFSVASGVKAQNNATDKYTLLEPLPCIPTQSTPCTSATITQVSLSDYFQYAFNLMIALAAAASVFMIVWGGFQYVTTDSWFDRKRGKERLKNSIYGLLMVICAYLVLKTVNPKFVELPTSIPAIKVSPLIMKQQTDFFTQLENDANQYKINQVQSTQRRTEAKALDVQLADEITSLNKQLADAITNGTQDQIETIKKEIDKKEDLFKQNRSQIFVESANLRINAALSSLTVDAKGSLIGNNINIVDPNGAQTLGAENLKVIGQITRNIYDTGAQSIKQLGDLQNSKTPEYAQTVLNTMDDALLKAATIYIETYKANPPKTSQAGNASILAMIDYKNSFTLTNPQKQAEKEQLLINLCKSYISKQVDNNLCK